MGISEPPTRTPFTARFCAAVDAYDELTRTWEAFQRRWADELPALLASQSWREWLSADDLRRLRAVVGEWVVAGERSPEQERLADTELSRLGARMAALLPPALRAAYARSAELSIFLIEQMRVLQGGVSGDADAGVHCDCGIGVRPHSICGMCGRPVCVLHSLPQPSRTGEARRCHTCRAAGSER